MFKSFSSSNAGRNYFQSIRSKRLQNALMKKAVRKTKALVAEAKKERGPPTVLEAA